MRQLILSTCGTSLLTNVAPEQRDLVTRYANCQRLEDVNPDNRGALEQLVERCEQQLAQQPDISSLGGLSAELNGLIRFYGGRLDQRLDDHILVCTDTWLGERAASGVRDALERFGHTVQVRRVRDLRTDDVGIFRVGMSELVHLCADEIKGYRDSQYHVIFNLTGGFKSVQGFMQALAMIYADESVYVFERSDELLRLPRLPLGLNTEQVLREHLPTFQKIKIGFDVDSSEAQGIPEPLLMRVDDKVQLSIWGDMVWDEASSKLLKERIWEPISSKLQVGDNFGRTVENLTSEQRKAINERLAELARHLDEPDFNPNRLHFKQLQMGQRGATHECGAWSSGAAKRLFGHFEGDVFVLDRLGEHL